MVAKELMDEPQELLEPFHFETSDLHLNNQSLFP